MLRGSDTSILLIFIGVIAAREMLSTPTDYTYYGLNTEWAPNVCQTNDCKHGPNPPTPTIFNIHGLWPTYKTTENPNYCKGEHDRYDYKELSQQVQDDLIKYWNSLYKQEDQFIPNELEKHGSCWNPSLGTLTAMPSSIKPFVEAARAKSASKYDIANYYLQIGMALASLHNVYNLFTKYGIFPSTTSTFKVTYLAFALQTELGFNNFKMECSIDSHGRQLLNNISLCFDLDFNLIKCPFSQVVDCKQSEVVYYLPKK